MLPKSMQENRDDLIEDCKIGPGLAHLIATMEARIQVLEQEAEAQRQYRQEQSETER